MNESLDSTIDQQIAHQERRIKSAETLHDEAKGTIAKKKAMSDLINEKNKLAELKAYAKIHNERK